MNQYIIDVIEQTAKATVEGKISFPEVVARLSEVGVSHYHVDFLRREATVYLRNGESHVSTLDLALEPIAETFSASEVSAAVLSSQTEGQIYPVFVRRALKAGCIGYVAYLDGRRVSYVGRLRDEHIEYFPS